MTSLQTIRMSIPYGERCEDSTVRAFTRSELSADPDIAKRTWKLYMNDRTTMQGSVLTEVCLLITVRDWEGGDIVLTVKRDLSMANVLQHLVRQFDRKHTPKHNPFREMGPASFVRFVGCFEDSTGRKASPVLGSDVDWYTPFSRFASRGPEMTERVVCAFEIFSGDPSKDLCNNLWFLMRMESLFGPVPGLIQGLAAYMGNDLEALVVDCSHPSCRYEPVGRRGGLTDAEKACNFEQMKVTSKTAFIRLLQRVRMHTPLYKQVPRRSPSGPVVVWNDGRFDSLLPNT